MHLVQLKPKGARAAINIRLARVPVANDLIQVGDIRYAASVVVLIHRDENPGPVAVVFTLPGVEKEGS